MKKPKNIASKVAELLTPVVEELGYQLWDIEYAKEGTEWILRITIDSKQGIGIEDCERVHRAVDPILDEHDPIETSYRLEVSSPGVERELRVDDHFTASIGEDIEVKLFRPIEGQRIYRGVLRAYADKVIVIETDSGEVRIPRTDAAIVKTTFDF
ncbi:MAG: ribosome maturation factor RimP [Clostridiales bacterium]|nr:ribosome maturation factor RimP [Clostridiales bacterium]